MDEGVVTSEKCWSGIKEKISGISREVKKNWLRNGHVSTLPGGKFGKINSKILMDEKSWKTWKRNQKSVMDEEMVQSVVMDEESVKNFVMDDGRMY